MFPQRRCKITFIAHGATIFSEENRISDNEIYPPLTEAGYEEIERICEFLKKRGIKNDVIYTSAGTRTTQSAEEIAKLYKIFPVTVENLRLRKCGCWNNYTIQQLIKREPEAIEKLILQPDKPVCEGAEGLSEFVERIGSEVENLINQNIGNRIIVVTYPDVIQASITSALKLPSEKMFNFYIKTGSATQISYYSDFNSLKYSGYVPIN